VCAGIDDGVADEILWKMGIVLVTIEGKLQDSSAWNLELIAQRRHVRGDGAEILGDKWQPPHFTPDRLEETCPRALHPLTGLCSLGPCWHMPRSRKTPEVIETNHVYMSQECTYSIDAPPVTGRTKRIPVIDRITPELSLGAKVIGRNCSDETRPPPLIQQEKLGIRPNIARIRRNEKREIADHFYALGVGVVFKFFCLAQEQELFQAKLVDFVG